MKYIGCLNILFTLCIKDVDYIFNVGYDMIVDFFNWYFKEKYKSQPFLYDDQTADTVLFMKIR